MSSRICVKNLPKHCTDQLLRKHFGDRGEVTDAKVIHAKDGVSRQFGFVGYRTPQQAQDAVDYFNRTYLDAARLSVEFAEKVGAGGLSRPWSKYSKGSSAHEAHNPSQNLTNGSGGSPSAKRKRSAEADGQAGTDDPQLAEFLQIMQPRRKTAMWANDDLMGPSAPAMQGTQPAKAAKRAAPAVVAPDAGPELIDGDDGGSSGDDSVLFEDTAADEQHAANAQGMADDGIVGNEEVDDLAYLRSRMRQRIAEDDGDPAEDPGSPESELGGSEPEGLPADEAESGDEANELPAAHASDEEAETDVERRQSNRHASTRETDEEDGVRAAGRLFLRNLPYAATEADLAELMGEYGQLAEVHLVVDRVSKKSKGIALVTFEEAQPAEAARAALDGSFFQGRLLHVLPARPPPAVVTPAPQAEEKQADGKKAQGYKGEKEAKQRSQAGNRAAWNTLFMRADTVAEAIAAHLGMPKAQLLDREAADLPVRMALGEAHVINLTKQSLGAAGVSVDALEQAAEKSGKGASSGAVTRSGTALIIKNLPYSAEEKELQELFSSCGTVKRLVLPPTKTLAIVEFAEAGEARSAFRGLAYKRFHHVPIYLEWAPSNIFIAPAPLKAQAGGSTAEEGMDDDVPQEAAARTDEAAAESCTLYIKNLAFATAEEGLQGLCDPVVSAAGGSVRSVKVARHRGPNGKLLSAGFGFVECSSEQAARAALKRLQGSLLDGHKLSMQLSMRKVEGDKAAGAAKVQQKKATAAGKEPSTKLVVRNVAFEATRKDIQQLFGPFGQLRSCRLPRKFDGNHRGFAFVDFVTKQEARNSMEAVAGTHLYGRRLVVEWAEPDDTLDDLRAKTAAKYKHADV